MCRQATQDPFIIQVNWFRLIIWHYMTYLLNGLLVSYRVNLYIKHVVFKLLHLTLLINHVVFMLVVNMLYLYLDATHKLELPPLFTVKWVSVKIWMISINWEPFNSFFFYCKCRTQHQNWRIRTQDIGAVVRTNVGMCGEMHISGLISPNVSFLDQWGISRSINVQAFWN